MSDHWTDRLSEYLDGELEAGERRKLEEHLAACDECTATLEQLQRVVDRAATLEDRPPATDLWAGIRRRIDAKADGAIDLEEHRSRKLDQLRRRRVAFSLPQLAAASIVLMVLSAGTAWLVSRGAEPRAGDVAAGAPDGTAVFATAPAAYPSSYDAAIAELEQVLIENRERLDTTTVRILEENLLIIDQAIAQAQRALALDPGSVYLNEHLAATMQQKLAFLRQAARMTGAVS